MISLFYYILYLVITKTQARILPVAESETLFPDSVTHLPKAVLAGGSIDSPRPQNIVDPPEMVSLRILRAA
jgi:hypothetical protein